MQAVFFFYLFFALISITLCLIVLLQGFNAKFKMYIPLVAVVLKSFVAHYYFLSNEINCGKLVN